MAQRFVQIGATVALLFVVIGPIVVLLNQGISSLRFGDAEWAALHFTLTQATLSAVISTVLAWPLAIALSRRQFFGKSVLVMVIGAPFILPVIVAVLGLLSVFGQSGIMNGALRWIGFDTFSIYGLIGVLLAHVYFNLPLATRLFYQAIQMRPSERDRLAHSISLNRVMRFYVLDWPIIRQVAPQILGVIFVICLTSFAVVLMLGGGPKSTTIELAIYQAFRLDLDFAKAASLAIIQLFIAGFASVVVYGFFGQPMSLAGGLDRKYKARIISPFSKVFDFCVIITGVVFLVLPIVMIAIKGLPYLFTLDHSLWSAFFYSVCLAVGSAFLSCSWAFILAANRWGEILGTLGIAVSPLVMGAGLFLLVRPFANPFDYALLVTLVVNSIMGLPFAIRILRPALHDINVTYRNLGNAMGIVGVAWIYWVAIPRLRPALGYAMGLVAALSMGDLGVIALFGGAEFVTLPLKIYQLMGAYRMDQAMAGAVILVFTAFGMFYCFERLGKRTYA